MHCIYVAIGQKESTVAQPGQGARRQRRDGVHHGRERVGASDPAPLQFIAPYAGAAIGEYFRDNGKHAVTFYDDLSKHAQSVPPDVAPAAPPAGTRGLPGRRLLPALAVARARRQVVRRDLGGGSLTALPIIETQLGDVSAYIPTNVISITDGQIFLETDLFYQGIRPAINVGISVSRVGSNAQTKMMKQVAGTLRLSLAQYRELAEFARFGSDLDKATQAQLTRGERMVEILKQGERVPMATERQVLIIFAANEGVLDDLPVESLLRYEQEFMAYMDEEYPDVVRELATKGAFDDALKAKAGEAAKKFTEKFKASLS